MNIAILLGRNFGRMTPVAPGESLPPHYRCVKCLTRGVRHLPGTLRLCLLASVSGAAGVRPDANVGCRGPAAASNPAQRSRRALAASDRPPHSCSRGARSRGARLNPGPLPDGEGQGLRTTACYTSQPLRYSRRTNWLISGLLVHSIFSTSHSILLPMPANWARWPVRAMAVSGPAASVKFETRACRRCGCRRRGPRSGRRPWRAAASWAAPGTSGAPPRG